ncbi:MAG: class I SAM-dependent methyltransferase [Candidatus Hodarchaeota archaeon]
MFLTRFLKNIQIKLEAIPSVGAIFYNAFIKRFLSKSEFGIAQKVVQRIKKGTLIDVGSGTGYLAIEIARRTPELTVFGIDLSQKMVMIASGHAKKYKNVNFKLANAADLPFKSNSIDFIVSTGSFHHWKHPIKVFNECYRVLKERGEAWIYDGCSNPPNEEQVKLKRMYGSLRYHIVSRIQSLHGFEWNEYNTLIMKLLEHSKFKKNFEMELIEGWMKIILKKQK